jgi:DNA-directed RNA polymerase-4 subunit 1
MDKMSIIAEVAGGVAHKSKNKAPHETLPQDFWDFIPDDNQPPIFNVTKKILSPYQVMYLSAIQFNKCSCIALQDSL